MKYITSFILLCSFFLVSCDMETVIDLDIPDHESVLVLNGLLETDTNARIVVSYSVGAFDNAIPAFINDANVLLYKDNDFIGYLLPDTTNLIDAYYDDDNINTLPMHYYQSSYVPAKDATYRVEVSHPGYTSISAETYIPSDVILYNIDVDTSSNEDKIGLTFSFDDNPNQQNYYRLEVFTYCVSQKEDLNGCIVYEDRYRGYAQMNSNDPSFPGGIPFEGYTFEGTEVVFTDDLFSGQTKTISLDVSVFGKDDEKDEDEYFKYGDCDTVIIEFSTFSDDTYSYYNSLGDHSEKGELGLFGGEVLPVYSNVENGLGVLISANAQKIYLKP